ncbi:unnamed protein product [Notodromas monacha]|uniref:Transmembrane protein n=1 Tax=Notodromas monacha TaxID=399045 RepID=A0A7R9BJ95_9CRUS|nr:unnamed protein product [Notodromas monacha]CAG0916535.1 unnamed protein product [Notodromas monacha]
MQSDFPKFLYMCLNVAFWLLACWPWGTGARAGVLVPVTQELFGEPGPQKGESPAASSSVAWPDDVSTVPAPDGDDIKPAAQVRTCFPPTFKETAATFYHCHTCRHICEELAKAGNMCLFGEVTCSSLVSRTACSKSSELICKRMRSCICALYPPHDGFTSNKGFKWAQIFGSQDRVYGGSMPSTYACNKGFKWAQIFGSQDRVYGGSMPSTYAWCSVLGVVSIAMAALSYMVRNSQSRNTVPAVASLAGDSLQATMVGGGLRSHDLLGTSRATLMGSPIVYDEHPDLPPSYNEVCSDAPEQPPPSYKDLYPHEKPTEAAASTATTTTTVTTDE